MWRGLYLTAVKVVDILPGGGKFSLFGQALVKISLFPRNFCTVTTEYKKWVVFKEKAKI
jgi:hypothetical protein